MRKYLIRNSLGKYLKKYNSKTNKGYFTSDKTKVYTTTFKVYAEYFAEILNGYVEEKGELELL